MALRCWDIMNSGQPKSKSQVAFSKSFVQLPKIVLHTPFERHVRQKHGL